MSTGNIKIYYYDPQSTRISQLGIWDQKTGYVIHFKPRSSSSQSNRNASVGEANVLKLEFVFYGNDGVSFKIRHGWVKHGFVFCYCSKRKAVKQFRYIQKHLLALGLTTLDVS